MALTYVNYMYRARGCSQDVQIKSETWPDKTQADVLPLISSVGDITTVRPDDPIEYGETRVFKVLGVDQATILVGYNLRAVSNMLRVVVTDPDA